MKEVEREVIKPASPSTNDRLQLSLLDVTNSPAYVPVIFFYKAEDLVPEIISAKLKSSLSQTLSRFYPLAGQREGISISCNDKGAVFTEARTDLLLHDFLKNLNTDSLERFYPTMAPGGEWPLLSVKVTFFGSGSGVAVSVSVSHCICDATSLVTFIMDWATTTAKGRSSNDDTIHFSETTIYPPPHISFLKNPPTVNLPGKCVMNRFVFESSKIDELKRRVEEGGFPKPTRVEAIMSLIWTCARNAWRSNLVSPRSTLMVQPMDLRPRIPCTEASSIGNLHTMFLLKRGVESSSSSSDLEICETVAEFRKAKETVNEMIKVNLQGNTLGQSLMHVIEDFASSLTPETDLYSMTSWCRRPFYEVDFGWGTPSWVGSTSTVNNFQYVCLIDSKDSASIEAWICLPEKDMPVFLRDHDLLAYAVLNPPVLI
ncbi:hypothetical protein HA466_0241160 [Hirschfeldia incana]|nr:hypothetical protein HA466_0241160 [Hirschfeldia incana]